MGESTNGYVLAMYDVRGKQEFIFRTNKLQEIVGGSWIIRDIFDDYLFSVALEVSKKVKGEKGRGIFSYKKSQGGSNDFSEDCFKEHLGQGYIGEVVYDGGGNFILLFENKEMFQKVTFAFTKKIMEKIGTLRVLGTCIEGVHFEDYLLDNKELYALHRINELNESIISPWACLPIVQVDRKTSMPLFDYTENLKGIENLKVKESIKSKGKLSKESYMKLRKYFLEVQKIKEKAKNENGEIIRSSTLGFYAKNEKILDNLVSKKGEDSQIAVIYIDGNAMGAKIEAVKEKVWNLLYEKKTGHNWKDASPDEKRKPLPYATYVGELRRMSENIQKIFVEKGIEKALSNVENSPFRIVVSAGDEVNFIVNAHDAFKCTLDYLDSLKEDKSDMKSSSCAGIAVFNSHAPYADAYRVAEEACESGKKKMKEAELGRAAFVDFQICQGAIGTSLEEIRERENEEVISRPWLLWKDDTEEGKEGISVTDWKDDVERIIYLLRTIGRSNVKGLISAAYNGSVELNMELMRIWSHSSDIKKIIFMKYWYYLGIVSDSDVENKRKGELIKDSRGKNIILNDEQKKKIIYDTALSYDMWFAGFEHAADDLILLIRSLEPDIVKKLAESANSSHEKLQDSLIEIRKKQDPEHKKKFRKVWYSLGVVDNAEASEITEQNPLVLETGLKLRLISDIAGTYEIWNK